MLHHKNKKNKQQQHEKNFESTLIDITRLIEATTAIPQQRHCNNSGWVAATNTNKNLLHYGTTFYCFLMDKAAKSNKQFLFNNVDNRPVVDKTTITTTSSKRLLTTLHIIIMINTYL